jgi:integrase
MQERAAEVVSSRQVEIPPSTLVGYFLGMCVAHDVERGAFICWLAYSALRIKGASGLEMGGGKFQCLSLPPNDEGGKKVFIPLLPEAIDLLRRRWDRSGRPSHGPVWNWKYGLDNEFKKVRGIMRRFAKGLKIGLTYPHAPRHHLASVALAGGFSAAEVALMLGHQDNGALVLKTYGHVIPSVLEKKVAGLRIGCGN